MRILVPELSPDRLAEIERRMLPGQSSRVGFLAPGDRLADIVARDERACADRGIRPEQIGDRLETLVGRAERQDVLAMQRHFGDGVGSSLKRTGEGVALEGFRITCEQSRGSQECPFSDDRGATCEHFPYSTAVYRIENARTMRAIRFPGLIIHLARDHHFFEGAVSYRLDPAAAIDVLELEHDVDYAPIYASESCWIQIAGTADPYQQGKRVSVYDVDIDDAREVIEVAPGIRIYVKESRCVMLADREHLRDEPLVIDGAHWRARRFRQGTYLHARYERSYVV